jgi:hypothetical protein
MSKSQITFSKKEKEKKKRKKKEQKQERKDERKANKSTDFNDMIAYVDEDGNLSATPPEPKKTIAK